MKKMKRSKFETINEEAKEFDKKGEEVGTRGRREVKYMYKKL